MHVALNLQPPPARGRVLGACLPAPARCQRPRVRAGARVPGSPCQARVCQPPVPGRAPGRAPCFAGVGAHSPAEHGLHQRAHARGVHPREWRAAARPEHVVIGEAQAGAGLHLLCHGRPGGGRSVSRRPQQRAPSARPPARPLGSAPAGMRAPTGSAACRPSAPVAAPAAPPSTSRSPEHVLCRSGGGPPPQRRRCRILPPPCAGCWAG
jgi:hypothetical protein